MTSSGLGENPWRVRAFFNQYADFFTEFKESHCIFRRMILQIKLIVSTEFNTVTIPEQPRLWNRHLLSAP